MPRRTIVTAGIVAAGVATLLWCAWRILSAELTLGTGIAAWGLWLVLAAALTTAGAYLREVWRHRSSTRRAGLRPLPAVMLLWVAGVSTLAVFAFMLPIKASSAPSAQAPGGQAFATAAASQSATTSATPATVAAAARASATTASRSSVRPTPTPVQTAATSSRAVSTASTASPVARSTSSSDAPTPTPSTSTTSDSLLGVLFPGHGHTKTPSRS